MRFCTREAILRKTIERVGEAKLGQSVACLALGENLDDLHKYAEVGVKFALIGIPESIGIRGNFGRTGAERAWDCFLNSFLNMQSNQFLPGGNILCLGQIYTDELQSLADNIETGSQDHIVKFRDLCAQLDDLIMPVITKVVKAGLVPIVIGGGHNNAFPILRSFAQNQDKGMGCINCDPHADFRPLEGRHSGNGFSYAFEQGFLKKYYIVGLNPSYNSEEMLSRMGKSSDIAYSVADFTLSFNEMLDKAISFFTNAELSLGLELDMDSIANMPASAFTPSGITIEQAREYIVTLTKNLTPSYLHISEAAPSSQLNEQIYVGKALATLVSDFIKTLTAK